MGSFNFEAKGKKISDDQIKRALIKLDEFLQIVNPVELEIFKIKIGKITDEFYMNEMILIVSFVLNENN